MRPKKRKFNPYQKSPYDQLPKRKSKQIFFRDLITLLNSFSEEDMKLLQYVFQECLRSNWIFS